MKKLAVAAAVALVMAGGMGSAFAQTINQGEYADFDYDFYSEEGYQVGDYQIQIGVDSDDNTNGIGSNVIGADNLGNNFQMNVNFDSIVAGASVMAIASNNAAINGSISLDGANITISAQDVEANAMAKAEAATESTSTATSNAFSGSTFNTTAIGALLSASIEVDPAMITDTETFTATDLKFAGEGFMLGAGSEDSRIDLQLGNFGEDGSSSLDLPPAEFAGNLATTDSHVNPLSVALMATNLAAIDASVNLTAVYQAGNVFHSPTGGMVNVTNLNINTTAVGAINSGSIRLGSLQAPQ